MDCYVLEVTALVALLKQMQTSIKEFDTAIAETSYRHPCWVIAQSLPGAGPVMAPRLLAAMGNGKRYQNAHEMQCASGIAPVTVASGRTRIIQFRRACPKFLRQTFHEWAQHSMKSCRGPGSITINSVWAANAIMPRFAPWRLSGNAFCSGAGKMESRTTNQNTSPASRRGTLLSVCGFPNEDVQKMGKP